MFRPVPLIFFGVVVVAIGFLLANLAYENRLERSIYTKQRTFTTKVKRLNQKLSSTTPTLESIHEYLLHEEFTDPYTYKPMKLVIAPSAIKVYSIGPDLKDQKAAVAYDPTNGLQSLGDVIFTIRFEK